MEAPGTWGCYVTVEKSQVQYYMRIEDNYDIAFLSFLRLYGVCVCIYINAHLQAVEAAGKH